MASNCVHWIDRHHPIQNAFPNIRGVGEVISSLHAVRPLSFIPRSIDVFAEFLRVLPQKAVRGIRINPDLRIGNKGTQKVCEPSRDHQVVASAGGQCRLLNGSQALQLVVIWPPQSTTASYCASRVAKSLGTSRSTDLRRNRPMNSKPFALPASVWGKNTYDSSAPPSSGVRAASAMS